MSNRGICLDFETFYSTSTGYTLKKMTTEAYIRDPRFAAICMGYDLGDGKTGWVRAASIRSRSSPKGSGSGSRPFPTTRWTGFTLD